MKHSLTAKEDLSHRVGNMLFEAKKGETIELSGADAETALSTGLFEYTAEVPETDAEKTVAKETAKSEKELEKLNATPKADLAKKAEKAGINADGLKKAELVDAISGKNINGESQSEGVK